MIQPGGNGSLVEPANIITNSAIKNENSIETDGIPDVDVYGENSVEEEQLLEARKEEQN